MSPLITFFAVYILSRNMLSRSIGGTPLHRGAFISINVMNFARICKDRAAISLSLCKIQEFPKLES